MNQAERLDRREELRTEIAKYQEALEALREEEERLLFECEHTYADGRPASVGGRIKVCAVCGHVLKARDEKLWG